ncbi:hypothetical protein ACOMHN_061903 [Nucella lapillus]
MKLGILHNSPPSTKRGCRAGRLHRLWHGLPPRSMALHSITASQCAFTQPPPADGPAFPPATSRPAVGSGQRPPLIQASCPTSYH